MMTNNFKELLPIGSVVRLRGAKKNLMIYGILQMEKNGDKFYDYVGVVWPEGNLGEKSQVLFNHDGIEEVVFTGLDTPDRQTFISKLSDFYESKK